MLFSMANMSAVFNNSVIQEFGIQRFTYVPQSNGHRLLNECPLVHLSPFFLSFPLFETIVLSWCYSCILRKRCKDLIPRGNNMKLWPFKRLEIVTPSWHILQTAIFFFRMSWSNTSLTQSLTLLHHFKPSGSNNPLIGNISMHQNRPRLFYHCSCNCTFLSRWIHLKIAVYKFETEKFLSPNETEMGWSNVVITHHMIKYVLVLPSVHLQYMVLCWTITNCQLGFCQTMFTTYQVFPH